MRSRESVRSYLKLVSSRSDELAGGLAQLRDGSALDGIVNVFFELLQLHTCGHAVVVQATHLAGRRHIRTVRDTGERSRGVGSRCSGGFSSAWRRSSACCLRS
jgi:hypothetical protein